MAIPRSKPCRMLESTHEVHVLGLPSSSSLKNRRTPSTFLNQSVAPYFFPHRAWKDSTKSCRWSSGMRLKSSMEQSSCSAHELPVRVGALVGAELAEALDVDGDMLAPPPPSAMGMCPSAS